MLSVASPPLPLPISNCGVLPYLSLLSEPSPPIVHKALQLLLERADDAWHEIAGDIGRIEGMGERWGEGEHLDEETRKLARAVGEVLRRTNIAMSSAMVKVARMLCLRRCRFVAVDFLSP